MWQRFTVRARRSIYLAQEEARWRNCSELLPEHLLLGIVSIPDSRAVTVLEAFNVDLSALKGHILPRIPNPVERKEDLKPSVMRLSHSTKRAFDAGSRECSLLGHEFVGTEHLLISLVQHFERSKVQLPGVPTVEQLRVQLVELRPSDPGLVRQPPKWIRKLKLAFQERWKPPKR